MMDLYTANTPNGHKVSIALEELRIPYQVYKVQMDPAERFLEKFLPAGPNNKIPVMVDRDKSLTLFESNMILVYLAEKSGKFLPENEKARLETLQWLFVQNSSIAPVFKELIYYKLFCIDEIAYEYTRNFNEAMRIFIVLNRQLCEHQYLAGQSYSIADMATFPWIHAARQILEMELQDFHYVGEWYEEILNRPAVQRGLLVPEDI